MKEKKFKLPENNIPEEVHEKARMVIKRMLVMPPVRQSELKEKK